MGASSVAFRRVAVSLGLAIFVLAGGGPDAIAKKKAPKSKEDKAFAKRFAELKKDETNIFLVKMAPGEAPEAIAQTDTLPTGLTMVAGSRSIMTPEILSPGDIAAVVKKNMVDIRKCYKKQLEVDPEWSDE